jgi:hypothetical protein
MSLPGLLKQQKSWEKEGQLFDQALPLILSLLFPPAGAGPKVGICNLSLQLRNIADNQIDCGIAD